MKSFFTTMIQPEDLEEAISEYFAKRGIEVKDIELERDGGYVTCDDIVCTAVQIVKQKAVK